MAQSPKRLTSLEGLFLPNIKSVTPGLVLWAKRFSQATNQEGKKAQNLNLTRRLGETSEFYDLASLTKIIFTTSAYMKLVSEKKIDIFSRVKKYWPEFPHSGIRLEQVLSHRAGLPWWSDFYKRIPRNRKNSWSFLESELVKSKRSSQKKAVYSDLDFLVLGVVLQRIFQGSLEEVWDWTTEDWPKNRFHFNSKNRPRFARSTYAPTEICPWRKRTLQGEVHDDNTWALGGVSTHAGLFGRLEDMKVYMNLLRNSIKNEGGPQLCDSQTARLFTRRKMSRNLGDFAYGFMLPSLKNPSCGQLMGRRSVGHLGFTGTSLWYDPFKDQGVVLLSNRVHPTRENGAFAPLRGPIHNWAIQKLDEKEKKEKK